MGWRLDSRGLKEGGVDEDSMRDGEFGDGNGANGSVGEVGVMKTLSVELPHGGWVFVNTTWWVA